MESTAVIPPTFNNTHPQPESHSSSHPHPHHPPPKPMMQTATTPRSVELPPPAWGSPAHLAARRAEKEWTQHLRAHASADAAARKIGKHARYVDTVDVVVRYSLPPDWSLVGDAAEKENKNGVIREGDAIWELPESDQVLVTVLKASSQPFFQRTGEFSKPSSAFKTPPLAKPVVQKTTPAPVEPVKVHTVSQETTPAPVFVPPPPPPPSVHVPEVAKAAEVVKPVAAAESNNSVQPRRTFLPVALIGGMFQRIGGMLLWLIPAPLRARLNAWWSPVLRAPPPPGPGRV